MTENDDIVILFADVVGSTRLYEVLGDVSAREKLSVCLSTMMKAIEKYSGILIKTIGDEIMCTYTDPNEAFQSACYMQELISEKAKAAQLLNDKFPLSIKIGLHYGHALKEDGDVYGDAVNVAARVVSHTKSDQILTTKNLVDNLNPMLAASTRFVERTAVKGRVDEIEMFEVLWEEDENDVTQMVSGLFPSSQEKKQAKLVLNYGEHQRIVSEHMPSVTIGRGVKNDLVVNAERASRMHAKVECRRGKFVLIDQSTNGTYIVPEDSHKAFIRRDEFLLETNGIIMLGGDDDSEAVQYEYS